MTNMREVFGEDWGAKFYNEEKAGNITLRSHADNIDYTIANYTPKCAYEGNWNEVTTESRGLIFELSTGNILARAFRKFFNYGQDGAPPIGYSQEVYAANKYDGSLGIAYIDPNDKVAIATRGSFHSTQAQHATALLDNDLLYNAEWIREEIEDGWTPLFEIIYPENRIVLNYGDKDYLQYLGSMRNDSGAFFMNEEEVTTFGELLQRPPRPNAEGYVVWLDRYTAVKIKYETYIALHKIVTGLSERSVWEVVKGESEIDWQEFVSKIPDELQPWCENVRDRIQLQVWTEESRLYHVFDDTIEQAWLYTDKDSQTIPRKEFALAVQDYVRAEDRPYMFSIMDSRSIVPKLFDKFKPQGVGSRPSNTLEDEDE